MITLHFLLVALVSYFSASTSAQTLVTIKNGHTLSAGPSGDVRIDGTLLKVGTTATFASMPVFISKSDIIFGTTTIPIPHSSTTRPPKTSHTTTPVAILPHHSKDPPPPQPKPTRAPETHTIHPNLPPVPPGLGDTHPPALPGPPGPPAGANPLDPLIISIPGVGKDPPKAKSEATSKPTSTSSSTTKRATKQAASTAAETSKPKSSCTGSKTVQVCKTLYFAGDKTPVTTICSHTTTVCSATCTGKACSSGKAYTLAPSQSAGYRVSPNPPIDKQDEDARISWMQKILGFSSAAGVSEPKSGAGMESAAGISSKAKPAQSTLITKTTKSTPTDGPPPPSNPSIYALTWRPAPVSTGPECQGGYCPQATTKKGGS